MRDLARSGRRLLAAADTGAFGSEDDGRTWHPGGVEGRTVWQLFAGPGAGEVPSARIPARSGR